MARFRKSHRLLEKRQFNRVFSEPKKVVMKEFLLLIRAKESEGARLGLAISKKTVAKASDRNRMKRLIRESFRQTPLKDVDVIALSRRGMSQLSNQVLNTKLNAAWEKVNALYEH